MMQYVLGILVLGIALIGVIPKSGTDGSPSFSPNSMLIHENSADLNTRPKSASNSRKSQSNSWARNNNSTPAGTIANSAISVGSKRKEFSLGRKQASIKRIVHPSLYAAWDEYNHLCVLAKFQATFIINYETGSSSVQLMDKMPANSRGRGRCDQFDEEPVLDVSWKESQLATPLPANSKSVQNNTSVGFTFRIIFQRYGEENRWGVQQLQLVYNTGHPVFRGAINPRKFVVKSNRDDYRLQFKTPLASSMLCPSPPPIQLYDSDGSLKVIARLSNMQLQAFEFTKEATDFDPFVRCQQVSYGSGVAHPLTTIRNDSLTFAMGVATVSIAILTVVGYALYRARVVSSEKYKNII